MLYHALAEPHSGVDIEQMVCVLQEPVDANHLRRAWGEVISRHAILRTAFRWETAPVQEVWSLVELPWTEVDLRSLSAPEREAHLAEYLRTDREKGFTMDRAPLLRLCLFRFAEEECKLVWTFHHALLDGRSFPIVLREVFDGPSGTPPPYRAYLDWLQTRNPSASETYWRQQLAGFTAPTPIPVEHVGDCAPQPTQGDADLCLSVESTNRLRELARSHDLTLNTIVQGAWAILLSRYSGEEDVVFGATRACRRGHVEGADDMVGLLINTLPVRVRVPANAELIPWLKDLRAQWVAMRPHEHTPLASVQSWSEVPGGKLLFDSIVVFENYDLRTSLRAIGDAWQQRDFHLYEQTNFALTLAAYAGEQLRLRIEFDRHRFADAVIARLLGHLATILEAIASNSQQQVGGLPMLTTAERQQLLHEWNPRAQIAAPEKTLHQLFAEQAARTSDAIAVRCDEQQLTYAELDRRAAQVAHHLRTLGVGPEVIVGLCVERSIDLVVGVLGILKAGGAYLPIDLAYPPERLAFMLEDAQAPVVVTQTSLVSRLPSHCARIVCLDAFEPAGELHDPATPDALAYVIFTSGSTGKPKGCCITHRNVVRLMAATHPWFGFDERDVWTMFHSVAFDFSVWEIWGPLLYGGRLIVVPHAVSRSPESFHELLVRERVTVLNQTPSAYRQLIAADATSTGNLALRLVIFGGEALEMQSLKPWFDRHGDQRPQLVNMYGITETTVHVTYRPLGAADVQRGSVIGVPIPDLEVFILDGQLRPQPIGVPGEMFVGGAGLARGYLRRPELTEQRFIPHPWQPGQRLYRTGDLARWLPGRDIEYLGRIDQQVKIRGFRIELGEIESLLLQHPGIREAVVVAREQRLIAYLVPANGELPPAHDLRTQLKAKLPDYMVPAVFVSIDRVPLTNNGKTDLRALPDPEPARPDTGATFVAPRTPAEETLTAIWQRVLRLERVGIHDNFFDLGGDSILSILVVAQARQAGLSVSPKLIFQNQTIAELAAAAPAAPKAAAEEQIEGEIPLTPIQRWFFEHEFAGQNHWNQALTLDLPTPLATEDLDRAVRAVAQRHPAFALRFTRDENGWHQFIAPDVSVSTTTMSEADAHAALDIAKGPLLRVVQILQPTPRLFLVAHHLAIDGVSWRVLLEDLEAALSQRPLAPPTTSFARWAQLLTQAASSPKLREQIPSWHELAATTDPPLPFDFNHGENVESSARTVCVSLSEAETASLLRGTRINDALLTALTQTFAEWTGRNSLLVDLEGHGREEALCAELTGAEADLSHSIGWFTAIYPARLTLPDVAAPNNGFGYGLLRHLAGLVPRSRAQVLFNYLGQFDTLTTGTRFTLAGLSTEGWHSPQAQRTHVVEINCVVIGGRLEARWTFSTNLHTENTIARVAENFRAALLRLRTAPRPFPLSPIQQLYHTLEIAQPGSGFDQWHAILRGPLNIERLQQAWQTVLDRHAALRTSFPAEGEPRQQIHDSLTPKWITEDWRENSRAERFAQFLRDDEKRHFDLTHPPLTRLALLRIAEEEWRFVWSHHHLQIDGWSWPIVLREVSSAYAGESISPAPSYTDYLAWLDQHGADQSTTFWRAHLQAFREPTPLPVDPSASACEGTLVLDEALSDRLRAAARSTRATLNTLVQTAWAILLSRRSGQNDVVFGASFSGRPAELPGVENIVGPMVNNLPVRVRIDGSESVEALVSRLHEQSFALQEHQFTPLAQIHAASELPWHARLFDTLLVFQNYVIDERMNRLGGGVTFCDLTAPIRTNYPLTLVVTPGPRIALTLIARTLDSVSTILDWLRDLLEKISHGGSIAEIASELPARIAAPRATLRTRSANFLAPRTDLEKKIAGVWCEAFAADEVGVRDNFFDLGGHSLLMMRVHARLREVLARDISIVRMFQHPTIESLARHLDGSSASTSRVSAAQERAARQRAALGRKS
jgi:amino acid adenylation domain-containing protein/non-ribosomal peptide synthase protein (TIGR01720 family)